MSSFKQYFDYTRCLSRCGIENVYFSGTRDDWLKVLQKLLNLKQYDVDGKLKNYVNHVSEIIKKFMDTYDGNPDLGWWNNIMTTEKVRMMSGQTKELGVEGWILHFFGIYKKCDITEIPSFSINVPIKLVNELTQTTKDMELLGDWVSVSKVNETTYKPDIGICILENNKGKEKQK